MQNPKEVNKEPPENQHSERARQSSSHKAELLRQHGNERSKNAGSQASLSSKPSSSKENPGQPCTRPLSPRWKMQASPPLLSLSQRLPADPSPNRKTPASISLFAQAWKRFSARKNTLQQASKGQGRKQATQPEKRGQAQPRLTKQATGSTG